MFSNLLATSLSTVCIAALLSVTSSTARGEELGSQFELGVSVGAPAVVNFNLGYWNESAEFVARFSGGFWYVLAGASGELGWMFDNKGDTRQYVGAVAGFAGGFNGLGITSYSGVGPVYGLNWGGWTASVGAFMGTGVQNILMFQETENALILPYGQIGYSWFIN